MSTERICAFAGHRPSLYRFGFDEEHTDCLKIKLLMAQQIAELISSGVSNFLSGMALGADIWGAETVSAAVLSFPCRKCLNDIVDNVLCNFKLLFGQSFKF